MTADRCPRCKAAVTATTAMGLSTLVVHPCGRAIAAESLLIEPGDRLPPRPDEWLTAFLADTADN